MPVKVVCQCGKRFAASDQIAGKTVQCPVCGRALAVPDILRAASQGPGPGPLEDLLDDRLGTPIPARNVRLKRKRWSPTMQFLSRHWGKLLILLVASVVCLVGMAVVNQLVRNFIQEIANRYDEQAAKQVDDSVERIDDVATPLRPAPTSPGDPFRPDTLGPGTEPNTEDSLVAPIDEPNEETDGSGEDPVPSSPLDHYDDAVEVVFSLDGQTLVTASTDGRLIRWNVESGTMIYEIGQIGGRASALTLSSDGRFVAAKSSKSLGVWRLDSISSGHVQQYKVREFTTDYVGFSFDGQYVVSAFDKVIAKLNVHSGESRSMRYGDFVLFMACSPNSNHIVVVKQPSSNSIERDDALGIDTFDLKTGVVKNAIYRPSTDIPQGPASLAFSHDGQQLVLSTFGGPIVILDPATWQPTNSISRQETREFYAYWKLEPSHDGKLIAGIPIYRDNTGAGGDAVRVELWDIATHQKQLIGEPHPADLAISSTGLIAIVSSQGQVQLFDLDTGHRYHPAGAEELGSESQR